MSGIFVEGAAKRAVELVPRAKEWKPDIVVYDAMELSGALAAAHTGARHVVHGLGLTHVMVEPYLPHTLLLPRCRSWCPTAALASCSAR